MIVDLKCQKCGEVREEYFSTYDHFKKEHSFLKCCRCGSSLKRVYQAPKISRYDGMRVPGYEKSNKDGKSLGAMFDSENSKWY